MLGPLAAVLGIGGLGLNYMGMQSATKGQERALGVQQAEIRKREMMNQLFGQLETARLNSDRELQETTLEQLKKLSDSEQEEIKPIKEGYYKELDPYLKEQKLYLQNPGEWQKQQDQLLMNSPYATQGSEGEGRAYMAARANKNVPSGIFRDAAQGAWRDAMSGFNNDRRTRQKQALEGIDFDYRSKTSDVHDKYNTKRDYISDLLNLGLGHSSKMGQAGARGLGINLDLSQESGDTQSKMARSKGVANEAQYNFLSDMFRVPEQDNTGGYNNLQEFLMDKYMEKDLDLNADDRKLRDTLRKEKKNKKFSLIEWLNNAGWMGK